MNMGLDELKNYIIGVILFVVVITGGVMFIGSMYDANPALDSVGGISQFNASFAKASQVNASVNDIGNSLETVDDQDGGFLGLGWINALVGSAFTGLKAVFYSMGFMSEVGQDVSGIFGIPYSLVTLIVLIITVIIVFAIWAAITRV